MSYGEAPGSFAASTPLSRARRFGEDHHIKKRPGPVDM
jgi:hypothetical protein